MTFDETVEEHQRILQTLSRGEERQAGPGGGVLAQRHWRKVRDSLAQRQDRTAKCAHFTSVPNMSPRRPKRISKVSHTFLKHDPKHVPNMSQVCCKLMSKLCQINVK